MFTDEEIPALESIDPSEVLTFEQRIAALESTVPELTRHIEIQLSDQVCRIETRVREQAFEARAEVDRESAARLEQFAKLALKLSRHLDRLDSGPGARES